MSDPNAGLFDCCSFTLSYFWIDVHVASSSLSHSSLITPMERSLGKARASFTSHWTGNPQDLTRLRTLTGPTVWRAKQNKTLLVRKQNIHKDKSFSASTFEQLPKSAYLVSILEWNPVNSMLILDIPSSKPHFPFSPVKNNLNFTRYCQLF